MVRIDEIFEVVYGVNLELINCIITNNKIGIPFVSRTSKNNGVVAFVEEMEEHKTNPSHTISVAGSGSVLSSFYQEKPYYSGRDLFYLKPKVELTPLQMLYYSMVLEHNKYKYSYGRQANKTIKEILVPDVNQIPAEFLNINLEKPNQKKIINKQIDLNTKNWKYFELKDIFKLEKCKCSSATELLENGDDIYYIGAKKNENGIMQKVELVDDLVSQGNCIVFIGDGQGSVGYTTYQEVDFIGSTTLTCGYNANLNKYIGLFFVAILDLERYRFSFGRKYGKEQVKKMKIKLPVTKTNEPDYKFMEEYIKTIHFSSTI